MAGREKKVVQQQGLLCTDQFMRLGLILRDAPGVCEDILLE